MLNEDYSQLLDEEGKRIIDAIKYKEKKLDILILDLDMPGRNGLEVLKQLKDDKTNIPVLLFSMHPEEQIAIRALRSGAFGYLSKDTADTELAIAVQLIYPKNNKEFILYIHNNCKLKKTIYYYFDIK